jgi:thioesterase domain-containing protein
VAPDDDFFELGGDSLMAVQVIHKLRNALGVDVPTHSLIEHPTGAELARFLVGRTADGPDATADDAHLVRLSAGEPGHRAVFLVHPVGGSVYIYRDLARSLGPGATVYGLQAQGVDGSRPPLARVEDMAGQYIAAIRLVQPQGPYVLGGSSFGGLVAFEMAQQLLGAGEDVEVVVMIDTAGPGDDFRALSDDAEILAYLLGHGDMDTDAVERLRRLPSEEQLEVFIRQGGAAERLSEAASVDDVRHFLCLFRANFQSLVQYQPRPYPGRVLFFRAAEADAVNPSDPDRSWRGIVQGGLDVVSVPGNHITMNLSPNVEAIGRRLQACLAEINQE